MMKLELPFKLAAEKVGLPPEKAQEFWEVALSEMTKALARGEVVTLHRFLILIARYVPRKEGRRVSSTGDLSDLKESVVVNCKVSPDFRRAILSCFEEMKNKVLEPDKLISQVVTPLD